MSRTKKPIRRVTRPPAMPVRFAWELEPFTPEVVQEMLDKADAPREPEEINLEAAANRLTDLVADFGDPPPPRAETIREWAQETSQAARDLLRRLGVDVKTLAVGGAVLSPAARENIKAALEPALILADPRGPFADLARRMGQHVAHERHAAVMPAIDALALLALAMDETVGFWGLHSKGAGANKKDATRKLAIRGAAAYRAGTGKEPGLNPEGPFARFLGEVAEKLGIEISPAAAVSVWRREIENNTERSPEADGLPE